MSAVRGQRTTRTNIVKSQDIFILLKLVSLDESQPGQHSGDRSARGLAALTGVGKTEVNDAINRSVEVGLAKNSTRQSALSVNRKSLFEFLYYGLKYVFPAKPLELTRGIPTAFAAPVLSSKLFTAGEHIPVWPYAEGRSMGQSVNPLYRTVPYAVARDEKLYAYLALVDAIRFGSARERDTAATELQRQLKLS